jgi:hypothetical protein
MKKKLLVLLVPILLTACAQWPTVENDLVTDVQAGVVAASDAYAAYNAVEQNLTTANVTTGKLSIGKVLTAATAITQAAADPSLKTAVTDLVTDANKTISDALGKGETAQQAISSVAAIQAATISTVATTPTVAPATPAPAATSYSPPPGWQTGDTAFAKE